MFDCKIQAFNSFIDDVFAFIIVMPTAHRLACFRDDVVFVIYFYQNGKHSSNISLIFVSSWITFASFAFVFLPEIIYCKPL